MRTPVLTTRWRLFAFGVFTMLLVVSCTRRRGSGNKTGVGTDEPFFGEPECGDRIVEGEEVCDGDPYCLADCSGFEGECGDGVLHNGEDCDAGDESSAGCVDCEVAFSWICSGEPSECEQTGLPSTLVLATASDAVIATYCEWFGEILFGGRTSINCSQGTVSRLSVATCVANYRDILRGCTVGELEAWAASASSACSLVFGSDPACINRPVPEGTNVGGGIDPSSDDPTTDDTTTDDTTTDDTSADDTTTDDATTDDATTDDTSGGSGGSGPTAPGDPSDKPPECDSLQCGDWDGIDCGGCDADSICTRHGFCQPYFDEYPCDPVVDDIYCNTDVVKCGPNGEAAILEVCSSSQHCVETAGDAHCEWDDCLGWQDICVSGALHECDVLGVVEPEAIADCGAQGLECSTAGCGDVTVTEVAIPGTPSAPEFPPEAGYFFGNFYYVEAETTLAEYKAYLGLPENGQYGMAVFESDALDGPYFKRWTELSQSFPSGTGLGNLWPAPNLLLESGKYYFLAFIVDDHENYLVPPRPLTLYTAQETDVALPFGRLINGLITGHDAIVSPSTVDYESTSYSFSQELTTVVLAN